MRKIKIYQIINVSSQRDSLVKEMITRKPPDYHQVNLTVVKHDPLGRAFNNWITWNRVQDDENGCTNGNPSWRKRQTQFSVILRNKQIT